MSDARKLLLGIVVCIAVAVALLLLIEHFGGGLQGIQTGGTW